MFYRCRNRSSKMHVWMGMNVWVYVGVSACVCEFLRVKWGSVFE